MPTTAAECQMAVDAFRFDQSAFADRLADLFFPDLLDRFAGMIWRRRARTDDMRQMLDDLGIEPPDYVLTDGVELTFTFEGARASRDLTVLWSEI